MSWLSLRRSCPLCGKAGTYTVRSLVDYETLERQLGDTKKWMDAHGLTSAIPQPPESDRHFLGEVLHPAVDSAGSRNDDEHDRCKHCHTLLPPEFRSVTIAKDIAITVAGSAGHGKTSWLLAILDTPDSDDFEIVRRGEFSTKCYEYAEPYTMAILRRGFRSPLYYHLLGTTLSYGESLTSIRTVDIKGEMFQGRTLKNPVPVIMRHLDGGTGERWLLLFDQVHKPPSAGESSSHASGQIRSIAGKYDEIKIELLKKKINVQKAIIWTFLDQAPWHDHAAVWLRSKLPEYAADLIAIGETTQQPSETLRPFLSIVENEHVSELARVLAGASDLSNVEIDGLAALLFRLQLLYSLRASKAGGPSGLVTKYQYLKEGGKVFVADCQEIALQLYSRHPRTTLREEAKKREYNVFPCGRFNDTSVWADQIFVDAMERGVIS